MIQNFSTHNNSFYKYPKGSLRRFGDKCRPDAKDNSRFNFPNAFPRFYGTISYQFFSESAFL